MPYEYPLTTFIKAFGKAYQTIDLRAALINDAEQWRVVSMIVRIKLASEDVVRQAYQQEVKGREIDSEKFKIIQRCLDSLSGKCPWTGRVKILSLNRTDIPNYD